MFNEIKLANFKYHGFRLAWLLLAAVFLFSTAYFINDDLWNDEIYTLQYFVFVPISTTLTDYHVPNNHVFFSLLCNGYLKLIGVKNIAELMQKAWILRSINVIFSSISIYFLVKCANLLNQNTSQNKLKFWILLAYLTSLPFYTFQLQIRGYSLLMALNCVFLYALFSFLKKASSVSFFILIIVGGLSIYTVPPNLLVLFGVFIFCLIQLISLAFQRRNNYLVERKPLFQLIFALLFGGLFGILLYSPVLKSVFTNTYVTEKASLNDTLSTFDCCFQHFMSWRILLLLAAFVGIFQSLKNKDNKRLILLLICVFFVPFVVNTLNLSASPERVFTELLPVYAVFIGFGVHYFIENLTTEWINDNLVRFTRHLHVPKNTRKYQIIATNTIIATSLAGFAFTFWAARKHVLDDLMENGRSQNLNVNYYQHYYAPLTEINAIKRQNTTIPLIVIDAEPHDIPAFLTAFNMPFQPENQLDNLAKQAKPFIALVRHTATFQQNMTTKYPEMQFRFLTNAERHYPKAIICSPK